MAYRRNDVKYDKVNFPVNMLNQGSNARRAARRLSASSTTPSSSSSSLSSSSSSSSSSSLTAPSDDRSSFSYLFYNDVRYMKNTLSESYFLSALLLAIPVGIFTGVSNLVYGDDASNFSSTTVFTSNFIGIIPLAWMLGSATEELAERTNQTFGGLLNATFGNAVELIVSVIALRKGYVRLVQTSLLGSILSNLLLVLGMSFLCGGIKHTRQKYNKTSAHVFTSMLLLACIAIAIPSCFNATFFTHTASSPSASADAKASVLIVSRVTALIMFALYLLYLFFQLYTHADMFEDMDDEDDDDDDVSSNHDNDHDDDDYERAVSFAVSSEHGYSSTSPSSINNEGAVSASANVNVNLNEESIPLTSHSDARGVNGVNGVTKYMSNSSINEEAEAGSSLPEINENDEAAAPKRADDDGEVHLSLVGALLLLSTVTICVSLCSELLVDAIQGVVSRWSVPESFIGLVLLPIVGNAAEHATAVTVAIKDKLDLSIGVAVGSSTQIALFLIPFITLLGWVIGVPMDLDFTVFETLVLVMSVLIVNFLVNSGETNWLEGAMLTGSYLIIAVAFYYHEEKSDMAYPNNTIAALVTPPP